ncbi:MAG: protein kinase [Planctomycetota bacterium]
MNLGGYEILGELGRGGMGVVYRARSPRGEEVAVKVLSKRDPETLARFERERRLLGQFTARDGFVPLLDAGTSPEGPYLVMPFLRGGTLRARLDNGALHLHEALALGRRLSETLSRAHASGIVHRDLKPENILFTEDGKALVADLGLAKHFTTDVAGASRSLTLSRRGVMRGTAGYMPAEQMDDAQNVKPAADVFALGAVLYECLTGDPAFRGEGMLEVLAKVSEGRFEAISRVKPEVPAWVAAAVERCLSRDPKKRFADAVGLRRALEPPRERPRLRGVGVAGGALALVLVVLAVRVVAELRRGGGTPPPAPVPAKPVAPPPPPPVAPNALSRTERAREWAKRGDEKAEKKDFLGAIADLDEAIVLAPAEGSFWSARGFMKEKKGDLEGAIADFEESLKLGLDAPSATFLRSVIADIRSGERDASKPGTLTLTEVNQARALVVDAWEKIKEGDFDAGCAELDKAIALAPRFGAAWMIRGMGEYGKKDFAGAVADCTRAIELEPGLAQAWSYRAAARVVLGDDEAAIADCDRALALDPQQVIAWTNRAFAKRKKGDMDGALADSTKAVEFGPAYAYAWVQRGAALLGKGEVDRAISDLNKGIELDPKQSEGWSHRGDARLTRGDVDGAIVDYDKAIALAPKLSGSWINRGKGRLARRDAEGAIADSTRALELDPTSSDALVVRAFGRSIAGELDGAIADASQAIALDPKSPNSPRLEKLIADLRAQKSGAR